MSFLFRQKNKSIDIKQIPIIINNRNRLTFLEKLINSLESRGYTNINIIDNASTYPPLLEYYQNCPYKIFRLKHNIGHLALWKTNIHKKFIKDYYVYTDPDVVPIEDCPENFLEIFKSAMDQDKNLCKIGFSLKIDDLPDCFAQKAQVIVHESPFYTNKVSSIFYRADIDTTFALYRPWFKGGNNSWTKMYRSAYPYTARHLPWYIDSENMSIEDEYYISHANKSASWSKYYR